MSLIGRLLGRSAERSDVDDRYARAMTLTDEVTTRMREAAASTDVARAVMADIWSQNHNVPFLTTVVEAVQEMKSGLEQKPSDLR